MLICILSILGSGVLSFYILRSNATEESQTQMQKKLRAMMAALDYAVSSTQIQTEDLPKTLQNEIFEISDINKQDIILYDLKGNYLISNKEPNLVNQKKIPSEILKQTLASDKRIDKTNFDEKTQSNVTSSYIILKNNMLEPIAVVYFPYYHNDSAYLKVFNKYLIYIVFIDIFIVAFGLLLSWIISKNLTNALSKFSEKMTRLALFDKDFQPIRYYQNDELGNLVKAYNKMVLQIQKQKERLQHTERERAWREMAKQVAHEVKNPLTPMKLTIQNFERKFDPKDPNITEKVEKMSATMIDQIDLIAAVASAFSEFAKLPEKHNEIFNLNEEISTIIEVFNNDNIFLHSDKNEVMIYMDKIYLNRIITNLITNAKQAEFPGRDLVIDINVEQTNKRINIIVKDNGTGISSEILERIFEPNFTSKNSGMGLGLTMVRKMTEDYKGEISVKSTPEIGTEFTISLPANV